MTVSNRHLLYEAAQQGHVGDVIRHLAAWDDDTPEKLQKAAEDALNAAAQNGHLECVHALTSACPTLFCDMALYEAATSGHLDCVAFFCAMDAKTPFSQANLNEAVSVAAMHGHAECLPLLIARCGADQLHNKALFVAADEGHVACVNILISHSNPQEKDSLALRAAVLEGHEECVDLLYPVSNPHEALKKLKERRDESSTYFEAYSRLQQRVDAQAQRALLGQAVDGACAYGPKNRKM